MISSDIKALGVVFYQMLFLLPVMIVMSVIVGVIGLCRWWAPLLAVLFFLVGMYDLAAGFFTLSVAAWLMNKWRRIYSVFEKPQSYL